MCCWRIPAAWIRPSSSRGSRRTTRLRAWFAVAADVGQGEELAPLHEKAKKTGAEKLYIEDLRKEFVEDFIWPTLKAGAVYEGKYLLGTSFARPLIAKRLVEIATRRAATPSATAAPARATIRCVSSWPSRRLRRTCRSSRRGASWDIKTREEEIDYAEARGIPVPVNEGSSVFDGSQHLAPLLTRAADLEDPANEPPRRPAR